MFQPTRFVNKVKGIHHDTTVTGSKFAGTPAPIGQLLLVLALVISTLLAGAATPDRRQVLAAAQPSSLAPVAIAVAKPSPSHGQRNFACNGGVELAPTVVQHIDPRLLQFAQERPEQLVRV